MRSSCRGLLSSSSDRFSFSQHRNLSEAESQLFAMGFPANLVREAILLFVRVSPSSEARLQVI